jgi:hypothetical protein
MDKLAVEFYKNGYNCSQCIIKAASIKFNLNLSDQDLNMFSTINNGFGIRSTCSIIIGCLVVLGAMFDKIVANRLRIEFLNDFIFKYKDLNCAQLKRYSCEKMVKYAAKTLEKLILSNIDKKNI